MQSFEIFQVTIKEWVFIIPFYFESNRTSLKAVDVINLVRLRLPLDAVNNPLNHEFVLSPAMRLQRIAKPLSPLGLSAARSNDFLNGDRGCEQDFFKLGDDFREIGSGDGLRVRTKFNLEAAFNQFVEHPAFHTLKNSANELENIP